MKIRLRGKTYSVVKADLGRVRLGECDYPEYKHPEIRLSSTLKGEKRKLEILIHECLHACCWDLDESVVAETAADIANALYKLGARVDIDTKVQLKKKR